MGSAAERTAAVAGARNAPQQMIAAHCRGIISARKSHHLDPGICRYQDNQYVKVTLSSQAAVDCCHCKDTKGLQVTSSSVSQEVTVWSNELTGDSYSSQIMIKKIIISV